MNFNSKQMQEIFENMLLSDQIAGFPQIFSGDVIHGFTNTNLKENFVIYQKPSRTMHKKITIIFDESLNYNVAVVFDNSLFNRKFWIPMGTLLEKKTTHDSNIEENVYYCKKNSVIEERIIQNIKNGKKFIFMKNYNSDKIEIENKVNYEENLDQISNSQVGKLLNNKINLEDFTKFFMSKFLLPTAVTNTPPSSDKSDKSLININITRNANLALYTYYIFKIKFIFSEILKKISLILSITNDNSDKSLKEYLNDNVDDLRLLLPAEIIFILEKIANLNLRKNCSPNTITNTNYDEIINLLYSLENL
jgi:hypothetical protein